jgi:hypothetical protein
MKSSSENNIHFDMSNENYNKDPSFEQKFNFLENSMFNLIYENKNNETQSNKSSKAPEKFFEVSLLFSYIKSSFCR